MTQPFLSLNLGVTPTAANLGEDYSQRDWDIVALKLWESIRADIASGITLNAGDIEIGAVELKNATTDDRAKFAVLSTLVAGDIGLGITDPILNAVAGTTAGAAVVTNATGTLQQYLRGLVTIAGTSGVIIASGTITTVSTVTNLAQLGGAAIAMNTGTRSAGTQRVTIATDDLVPVKIDQTTPGTTNNVAVRGATSGLISIIATGAGQIAGSASLAARASRTSVLIRNLTGSPETCYFGYTTGVTAGNGMQLLAGESVSVQNGAQIFFFSAGGTATIACAEDFF